jgi:hypothetical protein
VIFLLTCGLFLAEYFSEVDMKILSKNLYVICLVGVFAFAHLAEAGHIKKLKEKFKEKVGKIKENVKKSPNYPQAASSALEEGSSTSDDLGSQSLAAEKQAFEAEEINQKESLLHSLPPEILLHMINMLDRQEDICALKGVSRFTRVLSRDSNLENKLRTVVDEFLHNSATIPAVTQEDVDYLETHLKNPKIHILRTKITHAMPAINTPASVVPIWLFIEMTRHYPEGFYRLSAKEKEKTLKEWKENPDLPATFTTSADAKEFAKKLSQYTGRKFFIPNSAQVETMIRGRTDEGQITTTNYYFGNNEVMNHAWIGHKPNQLGVRKMPERKKFTNSYGLIHPVGNVFVRSSEGYVHGGAYSSPAAHAYSSYSSMDFAKSTTRDESTGRTVGFRVAEELQPSSSDDQGE